MNYYLVKADITETYHGQVNKFKDIRLVKADNEEQAKEKYDQYWIDKEIEYTLSYSFTSYVLETIE